MNGHLVFSSLLANGNAVAIALTAQDLDEITEALRRVSDAYADDGDEELAKVAEHIEGTLLPKLQIARETLP